MADSHEPLTPALFHVLLALADGDKHGYGIMKEVTQQTNGEVQLSTGTLYGIIKRLLASGWIKEVRLVQSKNDDPRRRYYRLTEEGHLTARFEEGGDKSGLRATRLYCYSCLTQPSD